MENRHRKSGYGQVGRGRPSLQAREARLALVLLAPTITVVFLTIVFPLLWNIWLSFKKVGLADLRGDALIRPDFCLDNYMLVISDPIFSQTLAITFAYAVFGSALSILLGLMAALILFRPFKGRSLARGLILSPYIAPVVAVAFTWSFILDPQLGIINWLGMRYGLWERPLAFFSQRWMEINAAGIDFKIPLALFSVILFEGWRYFPFAFLFILARLQAMDKDLYFAASVDGASPLQRFRHITMPQLYGVLANLFLFRFIWTVNKFDDIFLLTRGQAGTEVMTVKVYDYAFGAFDLGASSAIAMILFLFLVLFLLVYFRWILKEAHALV